MKKYNLNKVVYDLEALKKGFKVEGSEVNELDFYLWWAGAIVTDGSFSFGSRSSEGTDYFVDGAFVGTDANSIGPNGQSDFWELNEFGNPEPLPPPSVEADVFIDFAYGVAVVRR